MMAWMLYSAFVALIVAGAARAAEWMARLTRARVRSIWAGALVLAIALSATTGLRGTSLPAAGSYPVDLELLSRSLDAPLQGAAAIARRVIPPAADRYAALLAVLLSAGLVLVLAGVGRRFRLARRGWPAVKLHGVEVRVAPDIGPAVIGLVHPEIVVPGWLLARPVSEQLLVLAHESEHVRSRDPFLLALGWAAVIVAPWNPALWYMLSRLRLAVELDCDARVLGSGALPRSYGSLLIDVAQHASALRPSVLALTVGGAHLKQRILAMTPTAPRFARLQAGLAAALALAGVLVACSATIPTDQEKRPAVLSEAASSAGAIVEMPSSKRKPARLPAARTPVIQLRQTAPQPAGTLTSSVPASHADTLPVAPGNAPLILLDGVRISNSDLRSLDRTRIDKVEVIKGRAAAELYGEAAAVNGVIQITTKRAP